MPTFCTYIPAHLFPKLIQFALPSMRDISQHVCVSAVIFIHETKQELRKITSNLGTFATDKESGFNVGF